jgi:Ni/Co efflux regulator RcnB
MKTTKLMAGLMAISMVASHAAFAQGTNATPSSGASEQGPSYNSDQAQPKQQRSQHQMMQPAQQKPMQQQPMQQPYSSSQGAAANTQQHQGSAHSGQNDRNALSGDLVPGEQATNASTGDVQLAEGNRLPESYRSKQYIVDDWQSHQLSTPPRNHHWVQIGSQYALVASSGVIAQVH